MNAGELAETVKAALSSRTEKTLHIKADAHVPYAGFVKALDSLRTAGVDELTLLTTQQHSMKPGTVMAPTGLQMEFVQLRN